MSRKLPEYDTPLGTHCTECNEPCLIVGLQNEFDYSGTHCNHGAAGTEYPFDWGSPVSNCCDAEVTDEPMAGLEDNLYGAERQAHIANAKAKGEV